MSFRALGDVLCACCSRHHTVVKLEEVKHEELPLALIATSSTVSRSLLPLLAHPPLHLGSCLLSLTSAFLSTPLGLV